MTFADFCAKAKAVWSKDLDRGMREIVVIDETTDIAQDIYDIIYDKTAGQVLIISKFTKTESGIK